MANKPRNYDSPFNGEDDVEFNVYQDIEDIHNTDFVENIPAYPPRGSFTNLPADVFLISDTGIADTRDSYEDLQAYKDIENIED